MKIHHAITSVLFTALCTTIHAQLFDNTFDTIGYTHTNGFDGNIQRMKIQSDGKIVSAYDRFFIQPPQNMWMKVARTNADGLADTTFGIQGNSSVWLGEAAASHDLALQPDGKIIIAGQADYCVQIICGFPNLGVARFLPDGTIDSTFGTNGLVKSEDIFSPSVIMGASAQGIELLPNGKMIVSGFCIFGPTPQTHHTYVARLNPDGSPDNTFGSSGVFITAAADWNEFGDLELDTNGNIVVTGQMYNGNVYVGYLLRLLPNGSPDNSFGAGGIKQFYYPGYYTFPQQLDLRSDGKFVIGGYFRDSITTERIGYISLLEANGTFSNEIPGGTWLLNLPGWDRSEIRGIKVLGDDHILFCGILDSSSSYNTVAIAGRLNHDGTYDTTFNSGSGYALYQIGPFSTFGSGTFLNTIEQQSNGKILLGGARNVQTQNSWQAFTMMRIIPDSIVTVIPELNPAEQFSLYPSVNNGSFSIAMNNNSRDDVYTLEIIDVMGKVVYAQTLSGSSTYHVQFNAAPGMYYAHIRGREYAGVKSFVVD